MGVGIGETDSLLDGSGMLVKPGVGAALVQGDG